MFADSNRALLDDWPVQLIDRAAEVGLDFHYYNNVEARQRHLPETIGGGVAAFDYDLDGWCDLYFSNGAVWDTSSSYLRHDDALYRNRSGSFVKLSGEAAINEDQFSMGSSVGDLNSDGFDDVLVANLAGGRILWNQGDGTFASDDRILGRSSSELWNAPLIVDVNRDQHVDLFLANYGQWDIDLPRPTYSHGVGYPRPESLLAGGPLVLLSHGDGRFAEVNSEPSFKGATKCLGLAAVDLDLDLKPEIYIANDGIANLLFAQDREGNWREIAENSGVAASGDGNFEASMCVTPMDFRNSGSVDLYLTNYIAAKNTLYVNDGALRFRDASESVRNDVIGRPYVGWGAVAIDFDLDGWQDLLIANGHIIAPTVSNFRMPSQLAQNVQGELFDLSARSGDWFRRAANGRAVATLDYNHDGIMEAVTTYTDAPVSLVVNSIPPQNHWVCLEVADPRHRSLVGGRFEIERHGTKITIPWIAGGSYLSDSQRRWTVGLGAQAGTIRVTAYWPDGTVDDWPTIEANSIVRLLPSRCFVDRSPKKIPSR
ncbi:MAG: CRTAC1 family protein [Planctomycetaceae bacterium]|nr:CRTAC1 family protein [Planctomycetaceae bacterium]